MRKIGIIKHVQIQRAPLKTEHDTTRIYSPANIMKVAYLRLTPTGVVGVTAEGGELIDVHNTAHPQTRYTNQNSISMGFTPHYTAMQERFGAHLVEGHAGENMLVEVDEIIVPETLGQNLVIENPHTGKKVHLKDVRHAPPCAPFSQFCLQNSTPPATDQKAALQFLDNGIRGFYMTLDSAPETATISAGDIVHTVN